MKHLVQKRPIFGQVLKQMQQTQEIRESDPIIGKLFTQGNQARNKLYSFFPCKTESLK